jgi:hypothetical protein
MQQHTDIGCMQIFYYAATHRRRVHFLYMTCQKWFELAGQTGDLHLGTCQVTHEGVPLGHDLAGRPSMYVHRDVCT